MIGLIQGRLTFSGGKIQCFPNIGWEKEFYTAKDVGLDYIELITDAEYNSMNPLWSGEISSLLKTSEISGTRIYSVTVDHIMSTPLTSKDPSIRKKSLYDLKNILTNAMKAGVSIAVLPLLEGGSLKEELVEDGRNILMEISDFVKKAPLKIAVESDLDLKEQLRLIDGFPNVGICYDTGNRTYFGFEPKEELSILRKGIIHVHIKDKDRSGNNVMLGTGEVNFYSFFKTLEEIGYNGNYTLETSRGEEEISAAIKNLNFVNNFLKK